MSCKQSDFDTGDLHWEDYEELVKDVHQALGYDDGVTIECWGRKCKVEGPPGTWSQIDVLTRHSAAPYEYRTAIECKYWNNKVSIGELKKFAQTILDAKLNKGVVVSKMGFTDPAKAFAESHNIDLVELRKPLDKDWEGCIRGVRIHLTVDRSPNVLVSPRITVPEEHPHREKLREIIRHTTMVADRFFVDVPGKGLVSFEELISAEVQAQPDSESYDLDFPTGSVLTHLDNPEHPLCGCLITGASVNVEERPPIVEEIVIRMDDHVYMIMESLFDGRRFTITRDGEIRENTQWLDGTAVQPV